MSLALDCNDSSDVTVISTRLAKWYNTHSSIRRLWAIEEDALTIYVSLEPTADGGDALPLWLAMSREWRNDLQSIMSRAVHLRLVSSGELPPTDVNGDAFVVAEADWRETWIYA